MGNEIGSCASGEKSNKAQRAEERYQASAPLDAAAANGKDGQQQAAAAAPSPVDEPALTADAAAPDLNAAINLDETAGADRPLADAGATVATGEGASLQPPPTTVDVACEEESVVASVSAPVQHSEAPPAPQPEIVVCPPCDAELPEGELSRDVVSAPLQEPELAPSDAGAAATTELAAAACVVDVVVSPPPCEEQPLAEDEVVVSVAATEQSEAPPQPAADVVVTTAAAPSEVALSDAVPPPQVQIAVCPPPRFPDGEQAASEATADADVGTTVTTAESTDYPSVPVIELPHDHCHTIAGPCTVAPRVAESSAEADADVQLPAAATQQQQEEQDGVAAQQPESLAVTCDPVPPAALVEHTSEGEACSATAVHEPVAALEIELALPPPEPIVCSVEEPAVDGGEAPLESSGTGSSPSATEEDDSIAAAVLAAGNRSLELSVDPQLEATASAGAGDAAAAHVDVSAPVPVDELAAGATAKLNGSAADGEAHSPSDGHDAEIPTSPVSPTAGDASGLAQKKAKTAASPHSRIPVLQE